MPLTLNDQAVSAGPMMAPSPAASAAPDPAWLLSAQAVRSHSQAMLRRAQQGQSRHFSWHLERLDVVSAYVGDVIRSRYPTLQVPYHSRWRHFEAGGVDRWAALAASQGLSDTHHRLQRARARVDLAVVSVLLDAGAGPAWRYLDAETDQTLSRSEGLGVASLRWWQAGGLSSDPHEPWRADADGLAGVQATDLAKAFQVSEDNPLVGLAGRASLLQQLGHALRVHPGIYSRPDAPDVLRPGHLVDALIRQSPTGQVQAATVLSMLLRTLGQIWPGRHQAGGVPLGDCWPHPDAPQGWLPFHKLSQWMTYSLLEPLEDAGLQVVGLDQLTGLPEYRNGGLLLDLGLLQARDRHFHTVHWSADAEPIVEWRALTVAALDLVADQVRHDLGLSAEAFPLARVLEGGTWAAGRQIAQAKRPGGPPPVHLSSDGTVF
ncbi:MAG: hypothetical protein RI907_3972 [Pseudomonadota bacterium]|jgi:hypothetical protein